MKIILTLSILGITNILFADDLVDYKLSLEHQEKLNRAIQFGIETLRSDESKTITRLRQIELKTSQTLKEIGDLNQDIAIFKKQESLWQDDLAQISQKIAREKQKLAMRARFFYQSRQQNIAKVIFEKSNTSNQISAWYQYLVLQHIQSLDVLNHQVEQKKIIKKNLLKKQIRIFQKIKYRKEVVDDLKIEEDSNKALLKSIRHDLKSDLKLLRQGEKNHQALQFMIDKITGTVKKHNISPKSITRLAALKGRLSYPSTEQFVINGKSLIFKAKSGSEVKSIAAGRVIFSDWMRGYGLLSIIDHGVGYLSLYGRNKILLKERGEWVRRGDLIAKVGNTGGIVGDGLFFELRLNGEAISTKRWFKD